MLVSQRNTFLHASSSYAYSGSIRTRNSLLKHDWLEEEIWRLDGQVFGEDDRPIDEIDEGCV